MSSNLSRSASCLLLGFAASLAGADTPPEVDLAPLVKATEALRGLTAGGAVPTTRSETRVAFHAHAAQELAEQMPAAKLEGTERVLQILGLIPDDWPLGPRLLDLLEDQVSAYYDTDTQSLVRLESPSGSPAASPARVGLATRLVWVHELTHWLQDRAFRLDRFEDRPLLDDEAFAWRALVEGDAMVVALSDLMGFRIERTPAWMESTLPVTRLTGKATVDRGEPPFLVSWLLSPYQDGASFDLALLRKGGTQLVDHAFRQDPPRSSEQILHPEKWLVQRDDPVAISLPALGEPFAEVSPLVEGSFGEAGIANLLGSIPGAAAAAAGWGGDAFGFWRNARAELLLWITEWDGPAEATEFRAAFGDRRGFTVETSGTRVIVAWQKGVSRKELEPLLQAARGAPKRYAGTFAPDLVALGIRPRRQPPVTFVDLIESLVKNPELLAVGLESAPDSGLSKELLTDFVAQLRARPDLIAKIEKRLASERAVGLDKVFQAPELRELQRAVLQEHLVPAELLSGGRFTIPASRCNGGGLTGWKKLPLPAGSNVALALKNEALESQLVVVSVATPQATPSEDFLTGVTQSMRASLTSVVRERVVIGEGVARQYLEGLDANGNLLSTLVVVTPGQSTILTFWLPAQRRKEIRPVIDRIFSTVRCGDEPAAAGQ